MFKYLLFDLDGTIINSAEGITNAARCALSGIGIEETDYSKLVRFIGPPTSVSFKEFYGLDGEIAQKAINIFREYYRQTGVRQYTVYDGMGELLARLHEMGLPMAVATSKREEMAEIVLEEQGLSRYFNVIAGSTPDDNRDSKADVLRYALDRLGAGEDKKSAVLIGDRKYDVEGARDCGILCIGVGFGFAPEGELREFGADFIVPTVAKLSSLLISGLGEFGND